MDQFIKEISKPNGIERTMCFGGLMYGSGDYGLKKLLGVRTKHRKLLFNRIRRNRRKMQKFIIDMMRAEVTIMANDFRIPFSKLNNDTTTQTIPDPSDGDRRV